MDSKRPAGFFKCYRTVGAVLTLSFGLFICGCLDLDSFRRSSRPVEYYNIDSPCPAHLVEEPLAGVLRIKPLAVIDPFAADRIMYEDSPYSLRPSYYERWIANPASLVTAILARDLSESGVFAAVLRARGILEPDWEMSGTLETIKAARHDGRWQTEVTVHLLLYPWPLGGSQAIDPGRVFQKRYTVSTPCKDDRALSVVESISTGVQKLSEEVLGDIAKHVKTAAWDPEPR